MLETLRMRSRRAVLTTKALLSFGKLVRDPNRLDEVFEISDALTEVDDAPLAEMVAELEKAPECAQAFRARPRIGKLDLDVLGAMPERTLGRSFADHMRANGLVPEAIPTLAATDDLEYLRAHLYETHDIWHVVAGFGTDVAGELGLQAFYLAQTGGPLPRVLLTLGLVNGVVYAQGDFDRRVAEIARGFALGKRAKPFFGVPWAELWSRDLGAVRGELGIEAAS